MANVKISNLPVETSLAAMTGIAGYNATGTAQISGADIISNIPTVNNPTITLTAGTGLTGGGTFTLNQAGATNITFDASGTTAGLGDVLTVDDESDDGQVLAMIDGAERLEISKDQIRHTGTLSDFDIVNSQGTLRLSATGGLGLILNSSNTIKVLDDVEFDVNGIIDRLGNLGTGGQFLASTGSALEWTTPSSSPSKTPQVLTTGTATWAIGSGYNAILTNNTATTLSITGLVDGDTGTLIVNNSGGGTISWPGGSVWPGGTPPTLTGSGTDIFSFIYVFPIYYWSYGQDFS